MTIPQLQRPAITVAGLFLLRDLRAAQAAGQTIHVCCSPRAALKACALIPVVPAVPIMMVAVIRVIGVDMSVVGVITVMMMVVRMMIIAVPPSCGWSRAADGDSADDA
jgi:hypothetical protein